MKVSQSTWKWLGVALLIAALLCVPPVQAKNDKSQGNKSGTEVNPTNISVLDVDFLGIVYDPVEQVRAPAATQVATGRGITVAVLDGGFNLNHPVFAGHLAPAAFDFIDYDGDPNDFGDKRDNDKDGVKNNALGHGVFVAGMVLEAAPDALIMPIRVTDDEGRGDTDALMFAVEFAVENGADVVNISLESFIAYSPQYAHVVALLEERGVILVVSAGNDGASELRKLGTDFGAIAVGGVDANDRLADFSNYGDDTTDNLVFAPAVDLYGPIGFPEDDSYGYWSGTSFAAGTVSGAVALARELHPDWSVDEIKKLVLTSVVPVTDADGNVLDCGGRIDLLQVVSR